MEILGVHLTAWLLLGSAVIVSLQTTIYPSKDIYVREGSTARFSCSFPSPGSDALSLSVGGLKPLVVVLTGGVVADKINQSQVLGVLGGPYTVLVVTTSLAEIEFTFSATPALDGYTLQCISKNRFDASAKDNVSQIITIHVEYPPSPSAKNETFNVFLSKQPASFQLNCSDLLTGNPLPNVTWTYDTSWTFSVTPTGQNNSLLTFQIDSLDLVPPSLYLHPVTIVCTVSNKVGSTAREFTLNVSGTPSAPQQVGCTAATEGSCCVIRCTWNAPVVSGSSNITSYDLVIKRGGEEVVYNKTIYGGLTEYSIPRTSAFKSNEDLKFYIKAVSALGVGPQSSNTFKSPGHQCTSRDPTASSKPSSVAPTPTTGTESDAAGTELSTASSKSDAACTELSTASTESVAKIIAAAAVSAFVLGFLAGIPATVVFTRYISRKQCNTRFNQEMNLGNVCETNTTESNETGEDYYDVIEPEVSPKLVSSPTLKSNDAYNSVSES